MSYRILNFFFYVLVQKIKTCFFFRTALHKLLKIKTFYFNKKFIKCVEKKIKVAQINIFCYEKSKMFFINGIMSKTHNYKKKILVLTIKKYRLFKIF